MKIARSGLRSATVADLGLQGAAESLVFHIDYWSDLAEPELLEWRLFVLWLASLGQHVVGARMHTEWLRRGSIKTPSEWMFGEVGQRYRRNSSRLRPSPRISQLVAGLLAANRDRGLADIEAEIDRVAIEQGPPQMQPTKRGRRRMLRSDRKVTAAFRKAI